MVTGYDDALVKDICYNCGSPVAKQSYNYFRRMAHVTGGKVWEKVWCKVWTLNGAPVAFYYANRCRDHVRLVEIAVRKEHQGNGTGRRVLFDLLSQMKANGITSLTFRTPRAEDAQHFWTHMGAKIMDVKGSDYEMELKIQ